MNNSTTPQPRRALIPALLAGLFLGLPAFTCAHPGHHHAEADAHDDHARSPGAAEPGKTEARAGQGRYVFRYAAELSSLPPQTGPKLHLAHGGFAVDPRTGEVFFGLKGVGIIWMSNDLRQKRVLPVTNPDLLAGNFHNTTLFHRADGRRVLAFPDNEKHRVLLTTDEGDLIATLGPPTEINPYYAEGGAFNPTDTEYAGDRLYVADGYSPGNYISQADPWTARWTGFVFGGKATKAREYGLFGTAHGITWNPATRRLLIADRANSRVQSFALDGTFLGNTKLPAGSLPCDTDLLQGDVLVGCLNGPKGGTPAPFYVLDQDGHIESEVNPKRDFGLELFTHIHNATWKVIHGAKGQPDRICVLATAWNPGGFAVFEVAR